VPVKPRKNNRDDQKHFDVIVLGVGAMGSSTCFHLAQKGASVLGIEQFDITHEFGAHAGQSRIIRKAYFEHPDYVPLLQRAYKNWHELEKITGEQVFFRTGLLYSGRPDHPMIKGVKRSARKYKILLKKLSGKEMQDSYPQLQTPAGYETLFEPDAGFVIPEKAIILYADQAVKHGALIKTRTKVLNWKRNNNLVEVVTSSGNYTSEKLVITAGPWSGKMIPALSGNLTITRQVIAWVKPEKPSLFGLGKLPCWCITDEKMPGMYYGFPALPAGKFSGPSGFKLGHHFRGTVTDPDHVNPNTSAADEANLVYALHKYFPLGYQSMHVLKTCLYANTPDENFILGLLPGYQNKVAIAAGFSGHGFKFVSVVGEIMTDLALNENTALPIGFLSPERFL
jgi:sarcosine oxidase